MRILRLSAWCITAKKCKWNIKKWKWYIKCVAFPLIYIPRISPHLTTSNECQSFCLSDKCNRKLSLCLLFYLRVNMVMLQPPTRVPPPHFMTAKKFEDPILILISLVHYSLLSFTVIHFHPLQNHWYQCNGLSDQKPL